MNVGDIAGLHSWATQIAGYQDWLHGSTGNRHTSTILDIPCLDMARAKYTDDKGRVRWHRNDEVALIVKQLGDYLIIGGYPEAHAKRYAQIAHTLSRWPESIDKLAKSQSLNTLPGVGGVITEYLEEIIQTGTTEKFNDDQYGPPPPRSVLELTAIDRLGAKTARMLYQDYGIDSLKCLCKYAKDGKLAGIKGIGPKMVKTIETLCNE